MAIKNPFKVKPPKPELKRNEFDLSHTNNMSGKWGVLYPVEMREVLPGDSVEIKPSMFFKTMPMVFPTMSKMRAHLQFYYVRNRNLWEDWKDFITDTKAVVPPYLQIAETDKQKRLCVGSLLDYLDVPCSIVARNDAQSWSTSANNEDFLHSLGLSYSSVGDHSSNYTANNLFLNSDFNANKIGKEISSLVGDNLGLVSAVLGSDPLGLPLNSSSCISKFFS